MFRALFRLLGLAFLAGFVIPPVAALMTKRRYADEGRGAFVPDADDLDTALIFEGGDYASTAPSFTGGELLAWYGGGRLDLREATIAPGGADLRIRAIFGGLQLVVPSAWRVETETTPIVGGVADATTTPEEPDAPVLRVSTLAVFGGVAISNDAVGSMKGADIGEIIRSATTKAKEAVDEATAAATEAVDEAKETVTAEQAG